MARNLFTNARVVTPSEVFLGTVEVYADRIVRVDLGATSLPGAEDFGGDYLLPGLVDLDAGRLALPALPDEDLIATDLSAASAGCTTAFSSLTLHATEAATAAPGLARIVDRLAEWRQRGSVRCDHYFRLIVAEDCPPEAAGDVLVRLGTSLARVVSVPGPWVHEAREDIAARLSGWRDAGAVVGTHASAPAEAGASGRSPDGTGRGRFPLVARGDEGSVTLFGPHDVLPSPGDASPFSVAATRCLVSAGAPVELLRSVFRHHDRDGWPLPAATSLATATPARIAGLTDRGRVEVGLRADFVRVRREGPMAVPIATWRAGQRFS
jgi:alpha-D-ribose 1-methylphosphonate 5-triphosphate diphosphatase